MSEEIDIIFDSERELSSNEIINLNTKASSIPVDYLRKNLFNATTRTSKELRRTKPIYDDGVNKILVNRSLHQKHRDLLSLLFTESKEIITNKDGSMTIKTKLYHLAKMMGYKNINGSVEKIKDYLYDLRNTEMTFKTNDENVKFDEKGGHRLLGTYEYDTKTSEYIINIPSETSKYKILNFAVEIPREINRKIVAIDNKYAKTKALVSYVLSNKALKNGISLENICEKLDINISTRKSEFKKELKENKNLLADFNIYYDEETNIIKYEQLTDIKFHRAMKKEEILQILEDEKETKEKEKEKEIFGFQKSRFVGKYIKHKSNGLFGEDLVSSKIVDIQCKIENNIKYYRFELNYDNADNVFTQWLSLEKIVSLEDNWISDKSHDF